MFHEFCQMIGTAVLFVIGSLWFDIPIYVLFHKSSQFDWSRCLHHATWFMQPANSVEMVALEYNENQWLWCENFATGFQGWRSALVFENFELSITSSSFWIRLHPLRHLYTTFPLHLLLLHQSRNILRHFFIWIKGGLEPKSSSKSR